MEVSATVNSLLNKEEELKTTGKKELGKQDFLLLLVTQLKNQSPWNPLDGHEFVAQLATFSSLEELENIDKKLEESVKSNEELNEIINKNMSAALIGKDLKANDNTIIHQINETEHLKFNLEDYAKEVMILITDVTGNTVDIIPLENLEKGINIVEWDGENLRGEKVMSGTYNFTVEARNVNDQVVKAQPFITGEIAGVKFKDGETYFIVDGNEIPVSSVMEIIDL